MRLQCEVLSGTNKGRVVFGDESVVFWWIIFSVLLSKLHSEVSRETFKIRTREV